MVTGCAANESRTLTSLEEYAEKSMENEEKSTAGETSKDYAHLVKAKISEL